jgi:DMSO/TMAO reductase YedYZ heme-binding membrane subunit
MPPIFKALATISAWVLFIFGLLGLIGTFVMAIVGGKIFVVGVEPPLEFFMGEGISGLALILAVCAMKLRQMLE